MGYGVIGSPTDSGSVSLGSSPGTPARPSPARGGRAGHLIQFSTVVRYGRRKQVLAPSSSGLGRRPLKAVARVRIPSGLHERTTRVTSVTRVVSCTPFVRRWPRGPAGP